MLAAKCCVHKVDLRFPIAEDEASFKRHFHEHMLITIIAGTIAASLTNIIAFGPTYLAEVHHSSNVFLWAENDPRTLWMFLRLSSTVVCFLVLVFCILRKRYAFFSSVDLELLWIMLLVLALALLPFLSPWHIAKMFGKEPNRVWARDCYGSETSMLLAIDSIFTAMCLFLPLRTCVLWIPLMFGNCTVLVLVFILGSPHPDDVWNSLFTLLALSVFAYVGAHMKEQTARAKWLAVQRADKSEVLVQEQQEELSQLEAHLAAMRALMRLVCEFVFHAGESMRVVDHNVQLDELLGSMHGHTLEERMPAHGNIRERYRSVVAPLLDAPLREHGSILDGRPTVVLVPPVTFLTKAGAVELEILVSDTGMWHGSGQNAWRYLVGFRGVVSCQGHQSGLQEFSDTVSRAQSSTTAITAEGEIDLALIEGSSQHSSRFSLQRSVKKVKSQAKFTSKTSSSSSLVPIAEHDLIPTPMETISLGILELSETWHLGAQTSLQDIITQVIEYIDGNDALWSRKPLAGGQCQTCFSLLRNRQIDCDMCGACVQRDPQVPKKTIQL